MTAKIDNIVFSDEQLAKYGKKSEIIRSLFVTCWSCVLCAGTCVFLRSDKSIWISGICTMALVVLFQFIFTAMAFIYRKKNVYKSACFSRGSALCGISVLFECVSVTVLFYIFSKNLYVFIQIIIYLISLCIITHYFLHRKPNGIKDKKKITVIASSGVVLGIVISRSLTLFFSYNMVLCFIWLSSFLLSTFSSMGFSDIIAGLFSGSTIGNDDADK